MSRTLSLAGATALLLAPAVAGCGGEERQLPPLILEQPPDEESRNVGDEPPPTFPNTATTNTIRVAGRDSIENAAGVASAVYPAVGDSTRPAAVTLVDSDDWQGGVAASVLMSGELGAPLLVTEGDELPAVTSGTLARLDPAGAELADGAEVIAIGEDTARPDGRKTEVIAGDDPYELAAEIDRFHSAVEGEASDDVVIASGEESPFAMPAAAWAARSGDAVLFSEPESLPEVTRKAIEDHEKPDVYVLGPETVISEGVVRELEDLSANVERIEGDTAVENAIEFARYSRGDFGWGLVTPGHNFTLASEARSLDAAAAAPLATNGTYAPLLLTDNAGELPGPLRGYFLDVQPGFESNPNEGVFNRVWILGDQAAVSLTLQTEVDELTELIPVQGSGDGAAGAAPPTGGGGPPPPAGGGGLPDDPGAPPDAPGGIPPPQGPGLPGSDL